jgi:hypothetical protein
VSVLAERLSVRDDAADEGVLTDPVLSLPAVARISRLISRFVLLRPKSCCYNGVGPPPGDPMRRAAVTMELFGRRAETATLDRLLARAADGAGSGLVLWGEPGIGKTALLDHAVATASAATVLRCRGTRMDGTTVVGASSPRRYSVPLAGLALIPGVVLGPRERRTGA